MTLLFHPGDLGITPTQLLRDGLIVLAVLAIVVIPFFGFVIWMAAQVVAGFRKDESRKRTARQRRGAKG